MTEGNEDIQGISLKRGFSEYDTTLVSFRDSNPTSEPIIEE